MIKKVLPWVGVLAAALTTYAWIKDWYATALFAGMVACILLGSWLASQWQGIVPPDVPTDAPEFEQAKAFREFMRSFTKSNIKRWRRLYVVLALLVLVFVWDQGVTNELECERRRDTREEVRAALVEGDDILIESVVAEFDLDVSEQERQSILNRVYVGVSEKFPDPEC